MVGDRLLFLRLWLRAPLKIAAWSPSSPELGQSFARHIDPDATHPVLELGGGTGSITAQLLANGLPPALLYVVEREAALCEVLRRRFPAVAVIEGDAADLTRHLAERGVTRLSAVVSSLPIIWFSAEQQRQLTEQLFALLDDGAPFLQMTNRFISPVRQEACGLRGRIVDFVWRNLPPASIWSYRREEKVCGLVSLS
jgi:phosphatidylethanolamine/phosphatidyl-N-methylethanolamine N-methyltransferase